MDFRDDQSSIEHDELRGFRFEQGERRPLWALLMLPFLAGFIPLYRFVRRFVHWPSAWITVLVFEALLFSAEQRSLRRGHWVYNEARILGPRVGGVPIEEPLIYYLFSPLIIISIFHGVRRWVGELACFRAGRS